MKTSINGPGISNTSESNMHAIRLNEYVRGDNSSYFKYEKIHRILGFILLILSLAEMVVGSLIHTKIVGVGIGSWWASLNPLLAACFSLKIQSGKRLAAMLINAILGFIAGMIGCGVEISEYRRFNSIEACYAALSNTYFSFYGDINNNELKINNTCSGAFHYLTNSPAYDCYCIDKSNDCVEYDLGHKSYDCKAVFSPTPTSSVTLKYTIVSVFLCMSISMLCLVLSIIGCQHARMEENDSNNPLKVVNSSRINEKTTFHKQGSKSRLMKC